MAASVFDKYQIVRRIAVGGMGEVFLARQTGLPGFERQVILKSLLQADNEAPPQMVSRFLDEARVAASLNHPNVVSVFEAGVWSGTFFIAMEYIPGWNLSQLSRDLHTRGTRLPPMLAARIVHDAALGLDHAHHATDTTGQPLGIVHRDISPQNIMVRRDGLTKVVDFGVAWALSRESKTKTGAVVGKLAYMAPEQLRGERLDATVDQYALGIVLWELLTGRRLHAAKNEAEVARAVLTERPVHPTDIEASVPRELGDVAMRMLHASPQRRYASCGEVAIGLEELLGSEPSASTVAALAQLLESLGPVPAERDATLGDDFVVKLRSSDLLPAEQQPTASLRSPPPDSAATTPSSSKQAAPGSKRWLVAVAALFAVSLAGGAFWQAQRSTTGPQALPPPASLPATEVAAQPPVAATPVLAAVEVNPTPDSGPRVLAAPGEAAPPTRPAASGPSKPGHRTTAVAPPAADKPSATGAAQLSVSTTPWSIASLDGRALGSTPLHKVTVSAGKHALVFDNEDEGIHYALAVELKPAEWKKLDLDLSRFARKP